jgi:hypothetical protein
MVVSGYLTRGNHLRKEYDTRTVPDSSYWIVRLLITLQINWKLSYLEFSGDFHKWSPTPESYEEWESMYYVLDQLWYKISFGDTGNDVLDEIYTLLEYYAKPA